MLAYPEVMDWERVETFKVYQGHESEEPEEIHLDAVYQFLDDHGIDEPDPRKVKVVPRDGDGAAVAACQPLYDYIVFETEQGGKTYILTLGKWYEVSRDYIQEVDNVIRQIPAPQGLALPPIEEGMDEPRYLEGVPRPTLSSPCLTGNSYNLSATTASR